VPVHADAAFDDHDTVSFHHDPASGLRAIVAIHARHHGRAAGGCRMRPYATEEDALRDVLRLSAAMSRKAALAGVASGGAKAVIIGDSRTDKSEERLRAMGRFIDLFGGVYVSAPDVGIGVDDLKMFRQETRWVVGIDQPSAPFTARGTFAGLSAAVRWQFDREDLDGVRVAVQGVGSVGAALCDMLAGAGARLTVADVDDVAVAHVVERHGARAVAPEEIMFADVDVLAPCALGAGINDETVGRIQARVIAGCANNQLAEPRHGVALRERGILYAPDFIVSAGGLIAGVAELRESGFDTDVTNSDIDAIGDTLTSVFELAARRGLPESEAAELLAQERIERWRRSDA
jgi:leucine dehydrogenase